MALGSGSGALVRLGSGNDSLAGGTGLAGVTVGNGDDTLSLGGGANTIRLGNGADTVALSGPGQIRWWAVAGNSRCSSAAPDATVTLSGGQTNIVGHPRPA